MKALLIALALTIPATAHAFERDKALHAVVGGTIYAGARVAGASRGHALGACVVAGIAKEAYDATGRGQVEALDVAATALPCLVAYMIEAPRSSRQRGTYTVQRLSRDTIDLTRPER